MLFPSSAAGLQPAIQLPTLLLALFGTSIIMGFWGLGGVVSGYLVNDHRTVVNGAIDGTKITHQVSRTSQYTYQYTLTNNVNIRIETEVLLTGENNKGFIDYPFIFEVRHQKDSQSWRLPVQSPSNPSRVYNQTKRTVCIQTDSIFTTEPSIITVTVSTSNPLPLPYSISVHETEAFAVNKSATVLTEVAPLSPTVLQFSFPPLEESNSSSTAGMELSIRAEDFACLTVSVQEPSCPFLDLERNIRHDGYWHTMVSKAGMFLPRSRFPDGVFLVLVMHDSEDLCDSGDAHELIQTNGKDFRETKVEVRLKESISADHYLVACAAPVGLMLILFVFPSICCPSCLSWFSDKILRCPITGLTWIGKWSTKFLYRLLQFVILFCLRNMLMGLRRLVEWLHSKTGCLGEHGPRSRDPDPKDDRQLERKSNLYLHTTSIVAVFYALPAIQLVLMHLKTMHRTGSLDMCYFNFHCAFPLELSLLGVTMTDFNHIWSNVGYILLGGLGWILVIRKEGQHRSKRGLVEGRDIQLERIKRTESSGSRNPTTAVQIDMERSTTERRKYGVPAHFGIYKAQCLALIVEGVLSASYHVCPNRSNFHHDTCFMYVSVMLTGLKLYHGRHPDSSASACLAYASMAVVILVDVLGELLEYRWFWIAFFLIHVSCFLRLSVNIFYQGQLKTGGMGDVLWKIMLTFTNDNVSDPTKPKTEDSLYVLIVLAYDWNVGWGLYGIYAMPHDFDSHLLVLLAVNMILYFGYYVCMKVASGEEVSVQFWTLMLLSGAFWIWGGVYFVDAKTDWELSPARSRDLNEECMLLGFYDSHDLWHFLSAAGLFLSLMALLIIDDDLEDVPRGTNIRSFREKVIN